MPIPGGPAGDPSLPVAMSHGVVAWLTFAGAGVPVTEDDPLATLDVELVSRLLVKDGGVVLANPDPFEVLLTTTDRIMGDRVLDTADGAVDIYLHDPAVTAASFVLIVADNDVKVSQNGATALLKVRFWCVKASDVITALTVEAENNSTRVKWWIFE